MSQKMFYHRLASNRQMLTDFQNSFTFRLNSNLVN